MDYMLTLAIAVVGLLLFVLGLVWWLYRKNEYSIRIRELTAGKVRIITDTVARIKKDEEKVEYLQLWKSKGGHRHLPLPPNEAIDYDPTKKKKVVEVWWSPEGGYTYINDGGLIDGFQPLTTKQRSMMINQIRKKEARKVKTWQEHIPLIIGLGTIILLVAIILLFWGEFMKPFMSAVERVEFLLQHANLCGSTAGSQVVN